MSATTLWWMVSAVAVLWLGYVYVGYGLCVALLGFVRRVKPQPADEYIPKVSVLISARNEQNDIGWKIAETLSWDYPAGRIEVLVASDASEDDTDKILASIGDSRLRWVRMERRSGKNLALNRLAQMATGDILFFTDANTHVSSQTLRRVVRLFADEHVGCVTGMESNSKVDDGNAVDSGSQAYLGYESTVNAWESRIGSVLVCDGSIFWLRRSLYVPCDAELANDLELPMHAAARGHWVLFEPAARSMEQATTSPAQEFWRKRRICAQGALAFWRLRKQIRGLRLWQFVSRKFLRWLTPVPLVMCLAASVALRQFEFFKILLVVQALFYCAAVLVALLAATGRKVSGLVAMPFYFVLVTSAALIGTIESLFGRRFGVWEIATLSRGGQNATS